MVQEVSGDDEKPLDPEGARIVVKVRRLMMIASLATFLAVAAVIGLIGYRVFSGEGRAHQASEANAPWPNGARIVSSAMNDERLALTIETSDGLEVRFFDLKTFKPLGRLRLGAQP